MAKFSKRKVIKTKSVNKKNKNKNTRVKRRVSRGKSRRRVKRKYRGGGDYIKLKDKMKYYEYAKKLAELIYTVLHIIFIHSENKGKTAGLNSLMTGYKVSDSTKREKITAFLEELLDIVLKSNYKKKNVGV